MNDLMKIRGNMEFRFPLYVLIVADSIKQKKVTVGALAEPRECTWT